MEAKTAYCGIDCELCPAFIATRKDSDEERHSVSEQWSKRFKLNISPSEVNCDGCTGGNRLIGHCSVCQIRSCCREKDLASCALCAGYPCERLSNFTDMVPDAKLALEKIRRENAK